MTALHLASGFFTNGESCESSIERTEVVHLLLKRGANIDIANRDGDTALHTASKHGLIDIMRLLLVYGADLGATNGDGKTAFHVTPRFRLEATRLLNWFKDLKQRQDKSLKNAVKVMLLTHIMKLKGKKVEAADIEKMEIPQELKHFLANEGDWD